MPSKLSQLSAQFIDKSQTLSEKERDELKSKLKANEETLKLPSKPTRPTPLAGQAEIQQAERQANAASSSSEQQLDAGTPMLMPSLPQLTPLGPLSGAAAMSGAPDEPTPVALPAGLPPNLVPIPAGMDPNTAAAAFAAGTLPLPSAGSLAALPPMVMDQQMQQEPLYEEPEKMDLNITWDGKVEMVPHQPPLETQLPPPEQMPAPAAQLPVEVQVGPDGQLIVMEEAAPDPNDPSQVDADRPE